MASKQLLLLEAERARAAPKPGRSPFRYPGGKFYGLKFLLPFLDRPHDEYREPFVGGGSIFFAKPPASVSWLNDLDAALVTTYQQIADPTAATRLAKMYETEVATPARHAQVKQLEPKTPFEVAWRTYYLNRTSYSGILHKPAWGYRLSQSAPPQRWGARILEASARLQGVNITVGDFTKVVEADAAGRSVLMYLDPPYYLADQKRAYAHSFKTQDHQRLASTLAETEHEFCLSYDDCAEVRDLYSWANVYERNWLYNTSNLSGQQRKLGRELVITNYKVRPIRA
jgi:DNA adenine methylase